MVRPKTISPVVISSTEAQTHFGALIRRVFRNGAHIIVERGGFPVVAIIPVSEYEAMQLANRRVGETTQSPESD